jgi:hypothetical protein
VPDARRIAAVVGPEQHALSVNQNRAMKARLLAIAPDVV